MNEFQEKYFFDEVRKNKGSQSEIRKDDIVRFAYECGLEFKKTIAKVKIIDMIVEGGFSKSMYDKFSEFFYVPIWHVGKVLGLSKHEIDALAEEGLIKHEPILREYSGRDGKFDALAYPIEVLELDGERLKSEYDRIFKKGVFRIRIESRTEEEAEEIIADLKKIFEIKEVPSSYPHKNGKGVYTYLKMKKTYK